MRIERVMTSVIIVAWISLLSGCEDFSLDGPQRQPLTPPGIVPVTEVDPMNPPPVTPPTPSGTVSPEITPTPEPANAQSIIGRTTAVVVDAAVAKQNPNVIEVENKVSGGDPLSTAASAYVSLRSKPQILAFQSALNQFKALEDRNPSFEEFTKMMRDQRIEFAELYPYQMYGYDSSTGTIVVLEDKQKKADIYQAAGLNADGE